MLTQARADTAAALPGPSELLPGCPDAIIDLQTDAGVELVGGQWHYSDARVSEIDFVAVGHPDDSLGPGLQPNRTFDVEPHAFFVELPVERLGHERVALALAQRPAKAQTRQNRGARVLPG